MRRQTLALLIGVVSLTTGVLLARFLPALTGTQVRPANTPPARQNLQVNNYRLSGPYTHENLTVFLVHGEDSFRGKPFTTLEEAMSRRVVVVYETSEVNTLAIENVSETEEVFVQAGDIVKGGQQDRMFPVDLIVPSRSGKIPIDAFCVENGRWSQRGQEAVAQFSESRAMASTKELKMAAKEARSQAEVWNKVSEAQAKLTTSTNTQVRSSSSKSSLQLTLENGEVQKKAEAYFNKLSTIIEGETDVIGFVFAVNNRVSSADIYSSGALFRKLWPKLLRASAIEAVADLPAYEKSSAAASAESIREFIEDAERGRESEREINKRTKMIKREGEKGIFFETLDMSQEGIWIHRNYIAR